MIDSRDAAALGDAGVLVVADGAMTPAEVIAAVRAQGASRPECMLLLIAAGVTALDRAMLLAALGQLAVALAPDVRINALDIAADVALDDVAAAARFLVGAASTTGQIIELTP